MPKLIIGLGNPGKEYEGTRHNIGFLILDQFAREKGVELNRKKFKGYFGEWFDPQGEKIILVKPQTYMNLSGECVGSWVHFLKLSGEDILLIHDELDLPLGRFKAQWAAGPAGHGGLKSVFEKIGHQELCRLRVGVGHPGDRERVVGHVLSPFTSEEEKVFDKVVKRGVEGVQIFIEKGLDPLAQAVNKKTV